MEIQEILKMYNEDGLSLGKIGEQLGVSKSSIARILNKEGYILDKEVKQYLKQTSIEGIQEEVNNNNNNTLNKVSHETINTGNNKNINSGIYKNVNTVKCTFDLPQDLHRKLKAKCALEGTKMVDYVRNLLENSMK